MLYVTTRYIGSRYNGTWPYRYNVIQCNVLLHTTLQLLSWNMCLNSRNGTQYLARKDELWGVGCEDLGWNHHVVMAPYCILMKYRYIHIWIHRLVLTLHFVQAYPCHDNGMQLYVCVFLCFTVFTLHMFIICHSSSVFTLCHKNVPFHTTISVLISTKHSLGLFILCFRNVTHYLTTPMSISIKHFPAVAIFKWLSTAVVNFMWNAIYCQINHG